jgi:hypothetical protein
MRPLAIITLFFFLPISLYSQVQADSLQVNISLKKTYSINHSKKYYDFSYRNESLHITKDTVPEKHFDIEVEVKNTSSKSIFIWVMSTFWEQNFHINNNYIWFKGRDIDHNFPILIEIKPGNSKIYQATLVKSIKFDFPCLNCIYGKQVETTKLGLVIIDDIYKPQLDGFFGYDLAMEDESRWKMVWSNPLYLLTEKEANPDPVQISIFQNGQK